MSLRSSPAWATRPAYWRACTARTVRNRTHIGRFRIPNYADLRARTDIFDSLTAHSVSLSGLTEGGTTRRVFVDVVTANYFSTFGAPLARGREFTEAEERPGADLPVAILSYTAWQRLGGTDDALGRTVRLNGRSYTIVGVAAKGFGGSITLVTPELWVPTGVYDSVTNDFAREGLTTSFADRRHHNLIVVARLKPGASIESTAAAVTAAGAELEQAFPAENKNQALLLAPLSRLSISTAPRVDSEMTALMVALLSMSGLVLLIASFNLANMLLARGGARRKEFAIRLAIGGSRTRLVRQLLTEGFVLSLVGGAVGLLIGAWATKVLIATLVPLSPVTLTFDATPDARVALATLGFCMISTLVFGLFPAWKLARTDAVPELKDYAGELAGRRRSRLSMPNLLVMAQLAASIVMLASAGVFLRSAIEAAKADPGFTFDRGVMIRVDSSLAGYDIARSKGVYGQLLERLRARPDVSAVGLATIMPFGEISSSQRVQRAGAPIDESDARAAAELVSAEFTSIGTDYFRALGLSMLGGRDFTMAEEAPESGARTAIIDEPLAKKLFADGGDPIGREIQYASRQRGEPPIVLQIVGIAPGVRQDLFSVGPTPHLYVPFGREFKSGVYLHVRTTAASADAEAALLPSLRTTVTAVDANLPILSIETRPMFRDNNFELAVVRLGANIFVSFGAAALLLAAVGVYGVKAYVVSRRTREIGIRMALGATPRGVVWMVLTEGLGPSAAGIIGGLAMAVGAGALMKGMAYQGHSVDPIMLGAVLVVMIGSILLASWLPARRATRIQPVKALRSE